MEIGSQSTLAASLELPQIKLKSGVPVGRPMGSSPGQGDCPSVFWRLLARGRSSPLATSAFIGAKGAAVLRVMGVHTAVGAPGLSFDTKALVGSLAGVAGWVTPLASAGPTI